MPYKNTDKQKEAMKKIRARYNQRQKMKKNRIKKLADLMERVHQKE